MINDFQFAIRTLGRNRLFAASAIATLALGIGVNTTMFSLANGALFRSRSGIQDPGQVAWLATVFKGTGRRAGLSYPDYLDLRGGTTGAFTELAGYCNVPFSVGSGGAPERLRGQMVTGSFFHLLGAPIAQGRAIDEQDDVRGGAPVAMISETLWKRRFEGSPDVVGRSIVLNGREFAVIGIVGRSFHGAAIGDNADVWLPLSLWPQVRVSEAALLETRGSSWLTVLGRLRGDVSARSAQAAVDAVTTQLAASHPEVEAERTTVVAGAGSAISPEGRSELLPMAGLLLGITGAVLLIACANLANLLLARGAGRHMEISIRSSLGASRGRLMRQLIAESAVLAVAGAIGGLLLATWAADLLLGFAPPDLEGLQATPDYRVLLFTAGAATLSVCAAAVLPALTATRPDVVRGLRATPGAGGRSRMQRAFVVAELALSLVLLLAAGLSLRALQDSARIDLGFTPDNLTTASYDLVLQNYPDARKAAFRRDVIAAVRAIPGVESASVANLAPLGGRMIGAQATSGDSAAMAFLNAIGPEYFATMRIPIVRGRAIDERDGAGAPRAVVVNETLARRMWGAEDPIGRTIHVHLRSDEACQVVGVARDAKYDEATEDPYGFVYLAIAQSPAFDSETLIVRAGAGAANPGQAIERAIRALDPALPVFDVQPFSRILTERADKQRTISALLTAFGGLALALAVIGLYGVMAYATARRTREFGVRLALGASPSQLAAMIAREGLKLGGLGTLAGAALALPLARVLGALVFGVGIGDLAVCAAVCAALNAVVVAAAMVPARRAARLDPIAALRTQ